jgi:hypothetical protein
MDRKIVYYIDEEEYVFDGLLLSEKEIKALYRILEHEWVSRDDDEAMAVADKISKFVRENK